MREDAKFELAILAIVNGFYQKLLQDHLSGEVPTPMGLDVTALATSPEKAPRTLNEMRRWLQLLDMAVTPAMVRSALTPDTDPEIAEGLLRYYARKAEPSDSDRDKTDLIATFLYRNPRVAGQWERRGYALDGASPIPPFEIAMTEIMSDGEAPSLSGEEMQRLADLDLLRAKAEVFRDFGAFLDSGLANEIRQLKRSLGRSFYHPSVLAYLAPFNVAFGKKFDTLFRGASFEIKKFAELIEERGGSIVGQVDGVDVTVDLVASMDEDEILRTDYSTSLDRFRRVIKLKRSLEAQPKLRAAAAAAGAPIVTPPFVHGPLGDAAKPPRPAAPPKPAVPATSDPRQIALEETKLRSVEESIRAWIRAANPKLREIVPMTSSNLILTAAEADAYCADYLDEDSLRADHARVLVRVVAIVARLSTEIGELKRKRLTPSAKPHADALLLLLAAAKTAQENAQLVLDSAAEQSLAEKVITLNASLQKLRERCELADKALAEIPNSSAHD
ncbi:MAG TPA: hypothetical protein VFI95_22415 [Terriglobales bacterium]|nr:hypothetical protein [Terriglobales bacterium]